MTKREIAVAMAVQAATNGVGYLPKTGATCPMCGRNKLKITCTKKWEGNYRTRFHKCTNKSCLMCVLDQTIKSVQSG